MEQLELDFTQELDAEHVLKGYISALHKQLGYGLEGPHLKYSLRVHLQSESMSECHDVTKLLKYLSYLSKKLREKLVNLKYSGDAALGKQWKEVIDHLEMIGVDVSELKGSEDDKSDS